MRTILLSAVGLAILLTSTPPVSDAQLVRSSHPFVDDGIQSAVTDREALAAIRNADLDPTPRSSNEADASSIVDYSIGNKYFFRGYFKAMGLQSHSWNFTQQVIGDTIIQAVKYFILQRSADFRSLTTTLAVPPIDTGAIFIERSDSMSLYRYDPSSLHDILMVDFGDTIGTPYPQLSTLYSIVSARGDSVVLGEIHTTLRVFFRFDAGGGLTGPWAMFSSTLFGHSRYSFDWGGPYMGDSHLVGALINGAVIGDTSLSTSVAPGNMKDLPPTLPMLLQNYPNPFNPSTTIRYGLLQRSLVSLSVFNTLGQQVAVLQNGEQEPGYHEVRLEGSRLASGVYFYRIQVGDFVQTKTLTLLR